MNIAVCDGDGNKPMRLIPVSSVSLQLVKTARETGDKLLTFAERNPAITTLAASEHGAIDDEKMWQRE